MGKKKKKEEEPEASADNPKDDDTAQPDVFRTLFGDVTEQNPFSSIFSDNNPFKRKHDELRRGFGTSGNPSDSPQNGDSAKAEVKKRKASRDSVDGDPSETVKSKKEKRKDASSAGSPSKKSLKKLNEGDAHVDSESNAVGVVSMKPSQSGLQSDGAFDNDEQVGRNVGSDGEKSNEKDKKKRKKRKRDELERAYEMMKYGPSVEDEGGGERVIGKKRKKVDNPTDMLVVKEEGFDDEDKLLRTVFVGNLPLKTKKKKLVKEFSKFGEIESLRIRSVPILDVSYTSSLLVKLTFSMCDRAFGFLMCCSLFFCRLKYQGKVLSSRRKLTMP